MNYNFIAGKPVTGNNLIGRDKILKDILHLLLNGQSVVVIAPRRYGKTSLILELLNRIKKQGNIYKLYVDFFACPTKRILAEQIAKQVLENKKLSNTFGKFKNSIKELFRNIEFKQVINDFEFILDFVNDKGDDFELLIQSIDFIENFSEKNNKKMICAFDEFGDLEKLNGNDIIKIFRSKIQLQQNSTYIFSGSYESVMNRLFINPQSPFFRFARVIRLGSIEIDELKFFLVKRFKKLDIKILEKSIDKLLNFTKGHPYYTQLICQQIELSHTKKQIKVTDINEYIEQTMFIEINYLEKLWEDISGYKQIVPVILSLVKNKTSLYSDINDKKINVSRSIRKLQTKGIIHKEDNDYKFYDPFLEYWIKRTILNFDKTECV
jgi:hypothetical protein